MLLARFCLASLAVPAPLPGLRHAGPCDAPGLPRAISSAQIKRAFPRSLRGKSLLNLWVLAQVLPSDDGFNANS